MLLRSRIILLVSIVFVITFGGLILVGLQRERLAEEPFAEIAINGTEALWQETLGQTTNALEAVADEIAADSDLAEAIGANDTAADGSGDVSRIETLGAGLATPLIAAGSLSDVQILEPDGRMLFAGSDIAEPTRLLDLGTIRAVSAGARLGGIRQVSSDRFRVIVARPYQASAGEPLVLAVAAPVSRSLDAFSQALQAETVLFNTRGRLIEGPRPELWAPLGLILPQRRATVTEIRQDGRIYSVTSVPLADLAAGSAGLLVTAQDATESLAALDRLTVWTVVAMAVALIAILTGLNFYLRAAFRPLNQAVGVLGALSRGDTAAKLTKQSEDEIGMIAEAVGGLRRTLIALNDARRQRELQRRRQERFIRRQMETLAGTLEAGAREEVLSDLRRIVAAASGQNTSDQAGTDEKPGEDGPDTSGAETPGAGTSVGQLIRDDDQLGPLAAVLQQMSGRVVEQHRRLSELVNRLREALVRETELASLQQELSIARDLQHSVLPVDFPDEARYAIYGQMEAARQVGGDFYDFFDCGGGRIAVVIADVSGKGVPAAFFMAICRTLLKTIALFEADPARCVRQLNDLLSSDNEQLMFVTLFFGIFDPDSGHIRCVNAGHNPPFVVAADGSVKALPQSEDMGIGVMEDIDFTDVGFELEPGERLVLYTDGVTEAFNPDGEAYGETRFIEEMTESAAMPPKAATQAMVEAIHRFEAGGDQSDDITFLILQRKT